MRKTHPNLYRLYITFAILSIAVGLNFIFLTPAFMPLNISKWLIGLIFIGCGVYKLGVLLFGKNAKYLRFTMSMSVFIYTFWAASLVYDFLERSLTSLQLPLFVIGLAIIAFLVSLEPMTNPATEKHDGSE